MARARRPRSASALPCFGGPGAITPAPVRSDNSSGGGSGDSDAAAAAAADASAFDIDGDADGDDAFDESASLAVRQLVSRMQPRLSTRACVDYVLTLVELSYQSYRTAQYDAYQKLTNNILS